MNILITGHEGFFGDALIGRLKNSENFIVGLDQDLNLKNKLVNAPNVVTRGDVANYDLLRRIIADYEIDEIYHLASKAIVKTTASDPYTTYQTNIMGTVSLLEACKNSGQKVRSIVISTSDKAFGGSKVPYKEDSPLEPLYSYDTSKACQQLIALSYARNYELPVKIICCGNVYGPGDFNLTRIIPKTITRLSRNQSAILYKGSEKHIREFIYIEDVVDALTMLSTKGRNGEVYCCGETEHLKIGDLLNEICVVMGKDPQIDIEVVEKPKHFKEIEEQYLDASKLRSLGWVPKTSLKDGLRKSIAFYENLTATKKKEVIIKGSNALKDERGSINNYILSEPINWIGLISTFNVKANDRFMVRGNHFHPVQEQKVLVILGSYISVYKILNDPLEQIEHHLVMAGDLVITPPNMVHAQIFLEDTVLLNLVNGERENENYGKHTVHYELIKPGQEHHYLDQYDNEKRKPI